MKLDINKRKLKPDHFSSIQTNRQYLLFDSTNNSEHCAVMLRLSYVLLFIAVFGLKRVTLFSLRNTSVVEGLAYPKELPYLDFENLSFDNTAEKTAALNVSSLVMGLYRSYAKHDGTVKRNSDWIPATVHCVVGQGNVGSFTANLFYGNATFS